MVAIGMHELMVAIGMKSSMWAGCRPGVIVYRHLDKAPSAHNKTVGTSLNGTLLVYGHVHMAKTAGTSLNGMLALNFERVCGHKGYSHDFYQVNERNGTYENGKSDSITRLFKKKRKSEPEGHRGRVPQQIMDERGYEDCDYISTESDAGFWTRFKKWDLPLELHVPCRPIIEHLMSMCNHRGYTFRCNGTIKDEVGHCTGWLSRYADSLTKTPNLSVKCYNVSQQFSGYLDYMRTRLQPKRRQSAYNFRATNEPRTKKAECIWLPENAGIKRSATSLLLEMYPYFRFCDRCLGSKDDLLR